MFLNVFPLQEIIVIDDDVDSPEALVAPEGQTNQDDELSHPADVFEQTQSDCGKETRKAEVRKKKEALINLNVPELLAAECRRRSLISPDDKEWQNLCADAEKMYASTRLK